MKPAATSAILSAICLLGTAVPNIANPPPPEITAPSAILVDSETDQVLYEKNADARMAPASTTKIVTAILIVENCRLDEVVTAGKGLDRVPSSSLYLMPGEKITILDLLHAILLRSANDACVLAAQHIAGSVPAFVEMMNKRAAEMGAANTHFTNPNGLTAPNHYSTARDLALIGRRAIRYPIINSIVGLRSATISRSVNTQDVVVVNRSRFLKSYPGADGIKTGYTHPAGQCLVGSATRDGWRLVSVVLKSQDNAADTAALMDYGFGNFTRRLVARKGSLVTHVKVGGGKTDTVAAIAARDAYAVVPKSWSGRVQTEKVVPDVRAPVAAGARLGEIRVLADGRIVDRTPLLAATNVERSLVAVAWPWVRNGVLIMAVGLAVGRRYGAATAKTARRRRRRFQTSLRGFDRRW